MERSMKSEKPTIVARVFDSVKGGGPVFGAEVTLSKQTDPKAKTEGTEMYKLWTGRQGRSSLYQGSRGGRKVPP